MAAKDDDIEARIAELKQQLQRKADGQMVSWESDALPDKEREAFWRRVMAADQAVEDGPFESFLFQHRGLLHGVPSGVIYVSRSTSTTRVQDLVARVLAGGTLERLVNRDDCLHYCGVRRGLETNDLRARSRSAPPSSFPARSNGCSPS